MKILLSCLFSAIFFITACHKTPTSEPDNLFIGNWIEVMPVKKHITQGISLKENGQASSIGMATLKYETWQVKDRKITFTGKSIGNHQTIDFTDTLDIIEITPDRLILQKYGTYQIHYTRQK